MSASILLAEDDEHIARLVAFKLGREGYRLELARNGQEAVDKLDAQIWGLVILDVMMPLLDGWSVLRLLRERPALRDTPVLMLTAKNLSGDLADAAASGATRILRKPFDPTELTRVVSGMIRGGE